MSQSLWVDKYRPTHLDKLDFHKDQAVLLKKLVRNISDSFAFVFRPPKLLLTVVTYLLMLKLIWCVFVRLIQKIFLISWFTARLVQERRQGSCAFSENCTALASKE